MHGSEVQQISHEPEPLHRPVASLERNVEVAELHVSRRLRLAYLAPGVLKRLVYKREVPAVTLLKLTDVTAVPWLEQPERMFD